MTPKRLEKSAMDAYEQIVGICCVKGFDMFSKG
jgi:hypothetical protein